MNGPTEDRTVGALIGALTALGLAFALDLSPTEMVGITGAAGIFGVWVGSLVPADWRVGLRATLALVLAVGIAVTTSSCSTGGKALDLTSRCGQYQEVFVATQDVLVAAKRGGLLAGDALDHARVASQIGTAAGVSCYAAATRGDAVAVDAAIAKFGQAESSAAKALEVDTDE